MPQILRSAGLQGAPCLLAGRSLGSACTIELAARFEASFVGLILESAVMNLLELPMVAEALGGNLAASLPDPFLNSAKLASSILYAFCTHTCAHLCALSPHYLRASPRSSAGPPERAARTYATRAR